MRVSRFDVIVDGERQQITLDNRSDNERRDAVKAPPIAMTADEREGLIRRAYDHRYRTMGSRAAGELLGELRDKGDAYVRARCDSILATPAHTFAPTARDVNAARIRTQVHEGNCAPEIYARIVADEAQRICQQRSRR